MAKQIDNTAEKKPLPKEIGRGFHYIFDQIINAKSGSNISLETIQSIFRSRFRKDFVYGKMQHI